jgi:hypothetical protein
MHWRSPRRAEGAVEREKDELPCFGLEEMLAAEQKRDGEGGMVEREVRWRAPSPRQRGGTQSRRAVAALQ